MEWLLILEAFMELLAECRQRRSRNSVLRSLEEPGPLEMLFLRRALRRAGVPRRDIPSAMERLEMTRQNLDANDRADLVDDAEQEVQMNGGTLAA